MRTPEQQEKAEKRLIERQEQKKRKLLESGIDYDMSTVEYVSFLGSFTDPIIEIMPFSEKGAIE